MGKFELNKTTSATELFGSVSERVAAFADKINGTPNQKKLTMWSAAVLAFLIAPIALLLAGARPSTANGVNLTATDSTVSPANNEDSDLSNADSISINIVSESVNNNNGSSGGSDDNNEESPANIAVNGEEVTVPERGTVNEVIKDEDGDTTRITISTSSSSSGDDKRTSTNTKIRSHTTSRVVSDGTP